MVKNLRLTTYHTFMFDVTCKRGQERQEPMYPKLLLKRQCFRVYCCKVKHKEKLGFCLIAFTSDHHTFSSLFKVRWHAIGCVTHDIVVGLYSELFMRLSYYIHQGYGKKLSSLMGIVPWTFRMRAVDSTL